MNLKNLAILFVFLITFGCAVGTGAGATDKPKAKEITYMSITKTIDNSELRFDGGAPDINKTKLIAVCQKRVVAAAAPWPAFFLSKLINFGFGAISKSLEKKLKAYTAQIEVTHSPQTFFRVTNPDNVNVDFQQEVLCVQVTRASCPTVWNTSDPEAPKCADNKQTVLFDLILKVEIDKGIGGYFQLEPLQMYYKETKALSKEKAIVEIRASANSVWRSGNESFRKQIFDERLIKEKLVVSNMRTVTKIGDSPVSNLITYKPLDSSSPGKSPRLPIFPWSEPAKEYVSVGELKITVKEVGDAPTLLKFAHKFFSDNQKELVELVQGSVTD